MPYSGIKLNVSGPPDFSEEDAVFVAPMDTHGFADTPKTTEQHFTWTRKLGQSDGNQDFDDPPSGSNDRAASKVHLISHNNSSR